MKKLWIMFLTVALAVAMVIPMALPVAAAYPDDPDPGLVARYPFNEGTGLVAEDISENENDGQLMVNFGRALSFDGIDDYVEVGDIGVTGDWTVQFWANLKSTNQTIYYPISLCAPTALWSGGIFIAYTGDKWGIYDGTNVILDAPIAINEWHHYAVTKSGTTYTMYLDEVSGASGTLQDIDINALRFGYRGDNYWPFDGIIDEIKISNIALTSFDTSSPPTVDADTVGLWHFDEGYRQIAYDSTGSNDGQLGSTPGSDSNDPTWVVSPFKNSGPTWVTSKTDYGTALEFDGYTNYVKITGDPSFDMTGEFTIEAWINGNAFQSSYYDLIVLNKYGVWCFGVFRGSKLIFGETGWQGSFGKQIYSDPLTWNTDTWYHVAVVYDINNNTADFYRDGIPVGINKQSVEQEGIDDPSYITIDYPHMVSFNGIIDEVRIWDSALTADQLDDMTAPEVLDYGPIAEGSDLVVSASDGDGTGVKSFEYSWDGMTYDNVGTGIPTGGREQGIYGIYFRTTDYAMNTDEIVATVVIYDPSAGFVTGGGWIYSDPGAYVPDPNLEGKASFGFVSKYKKGASTPDGQTEFQFKAGDLNFHSTSYEWLIVTGSDYAKFKGVGTINGEGEYKFQIWAGDDTPDTFRIKIWTEDAEGNETVVYDNVTDQEMGGGQIVVHTAKK